MCVWVGSLITALWSCWELYLTTYTCACVHVLASWYGCLCVAAETLLWRRNLYLPVACPLYHVQYALTACCNGPCMSINDAILDSSSPLIWLLHKWLQVRFSVAAAVFQEAQNKYPDGRDFCLGARSGLMHSPALSCTFSVLGSVQEMRTSAHAVQVWG